MVMLENFPFESNKFDLVIFREVIEHMEKEEGEKVLDNISRVLKPNGSLLISTPNRYSPEGVISSTFTMQKWNAWDPNHIHIYNVYEIKKSLQKHGFEIVDQIGEYYFFNILNFLYVRYPSFAFLRFLRKTLDNKLGYIWPLSNFGFVIEFLCKKK
jgi:SAM-dependent methyltransferase